MSKSDSLMERPSTDVELLPQSPLAPRAKELAFEGAVQALSLLVGYGRVYIEAQHLKNQSAAAWEENDRAIALLEAETAQHLRKLEAEMAGEKEKTERLRMILDHLQRSGEDSDSPLGRALAEAFRRGDFT